MGVHACLCRRCVAAFSLVFLTVTLFAGVRTACADVALRYDGIESAGYGDFALLPSEFRRSIGYDGHMVVEALPSGVELMDMRWNGGSGNISPSEETSYKWDYTAFVWKTPDDLYDGFSHDVGEIRLRFRNAALLSDSSYADVVISFRPSIALAKDPAPPYRDSLTFANRVPGNTPFLLFALGDDSLWVNSGSLTTDADGLWYTTRRSHVHLAGLPGDERCGLAVLSRTGCTVKVCKPGTSTLVDGRNHACVFGFSDLDYPDYSEGVSDYDVEVGVSNLHDGHARYNGRYTEGVSLESGFVGDAHTLPYNGGFGQNSVAALMQDPNTSLLRKVGTHIVGSHITNGDDGYGADCGNDIRSSFAVKAGPSFSFTLWQSYCGDRFLGGSRGPRGTLRVRKVVLDGQGEPPGRTFDASLKIGSDAEKAFSLTDGATETFYDIPAGEECVVTEPSHAGFDFSYGVQPSSALVNGVTNGCKVRVSANSTVTVTLNNRVVRGGFRLTKRDVAAGDVTQGDADLSGARFEVSVAPGQGPVWVGGNRFDPGDVVMSLTTSRLASDPASGPDHACYGALTAPDALPCGTYVVTEVDPPPGYRLADPVSRTVSISHAGYQ